MKILVKIERAIVLTCCLFLASAFCAVVFLRYVFETDLFAYEEWVLTIAFLLYFTGGALATHGNSHIKADILQEYIRSDWKKDLYSGIILLIEATIVALLTWYAANMFFNQFSRWPNIPTTPVYKIPLAVPRFFIVSGFALMTLHAFINGIQKIRSCRNIFYSPTTGVN